MCAFVDWKEPVLFLHFPFRCNTPCCMTSSLTMYCLEVPPAPILASRRTIRSCWLATHRFSTNNTRWVGSNFMKIMAETCWSTCTCTCLTEFALIFCGRNFLLCLFVVAGGVEASVWCPGSGGSNGREKQGTKSWPKSSPQYVWRQYLIHIQLRTVLVIAESAWINIWQACLLNSRLATPGVFHGNGGWVKSLL